jgi:hypothetical protein
LQLVKYLESRAAIKKELREKKAVAYEHLIKGLFRIVFGEKMGNPMQPQEWQTFFVQTIEHLTIWGSDEVIRCFANFRTGLEEPAKALQKLGVLMLAVRKDLGNSNIGLTYQNLLGMFINDIEQLGPSKGVKPPPGTSKPPPAEPTRD